MRKIQIKSFVQGNTVVQLSNIYIAYEKYSLHTSLANMPCSEKKKLN